LGIEKCGEKGKGGKERFVRKGIESSRLNVVGPSRRIRSRETEKENGWVLVKQKFKKGKPSSRSKRIVDRRIDVGGISQGEPGKKEA